MTTIGIASPTVAEALTQFLVEQKQRLATVERLTEALRQLGIQLEGE